MEHVHSRAGHLSTEGGSGQMGLRQHYSLQLKKLRFSHPTEQGHVLPAVRSSLWTSCSLHILHPCSPITGAADFRFCSQSFSDVMYLLYVTRASFPPGGQNVLNFSCPDWRVTPTWKWHWVVESLLSIEIGLFLYVVYAWLFPLYQQMLGTLFCFCPLDKNFKGICFISCSGLLWGNKILI